MGMQIDFNNVRKQALYAFSNVCDKLNNAIKKDGTIEIDTETLQDEMDWLRTCLYGIGASYIEGNEEVKCVAEEIEGEISHFNPDER